MSFLQPLILLALPLIALPIIIHLINQWRYQTKSWGAMMFLLAANRMNRGLAKLRQWLILAMRTLAIAGLIFAVARPLASGLLGFGGGNTDTTLVLMDRSPSMQQQGLGGLSKIETARRQIADALQKLGSNHWVAIDSTSAKPQTFESLEAMIESPALQPSSATSDLPALMQSALDYLQTNNPGPTEIWICSDLRQSDWKADSGSWNLVREGFQSVPQSVRFHLLAYPNPAKENISVRVTEVKRTSTNENGVVDNALLISMQFARSTDDSENTNRVIPLQIEIDGARSELSVELTGARTELRNHRVPLAGNQVSGWGKVSIPADDNNADNDYYFVYAEQAPRRVVVVSEDRTATRPLEIAAGISASGDTNSTVEVISPDQLDSLVLEGAALLVWQTSLPDSSAAPAIDNYVACGGQVIFFPPSSLTSGLGDAGTDAYAGVRWREWMAGSKVMVENWRGDQDLLAATESGVGLPVGQIEIDGYAKLESDVELSKLGTLSGGDALIARLPTGRGGVYFCTVSADPRTSTLAKSGIVLFVAIQRAIEHGQEALGNTTARVAGPAEEPTGEWRMVAGMPDVLSTEYPVHRGVFQAGERLFAINRAGAEDQRDQVEDKVVEELFAGLPFSRVDEAAGNLSGIVREVWRLFLVAMILALLAEAILCIPRTLRPRSQALSAPIS